MDGVMSFNPITKCVTRLNPKTLPQSFQHWCKKSIIKTIGLKKLHMVDELPLPGRLRANMAALCLSDFLVEADKLTAQAHTSDLYPATCLITDTNVNLRLLPEGEEVNHEDLRLLTWFEEQNRIIVVEEQTKTLKDTIYQCSQDQTVIDEKFIWLLIDELVQYISDSNIPPTTRLSPDCVHFLPNHQVFIEIDPNEGSDHFISFGSTVTIYEAPEVIGNNNPDSRALVWSIGCVLYEAVALEPAFYDKEGNNPFQVTMQLMSGYVPMIASLVCSQDLKNVIAHCIVHDASRRITLQRLAEVARSKNEA